MGKGLGLRVGAHWRSSGLHLPPVCTRRSALICAANKGHVESVKMLLDVPGIEVNAKDKYGCGAGV